MMRKFLMWIFRISNRTSCYNGCFFYTKNRCNLFENGHVAQHPCEEYYKPHTPTNKELLEKALKECEEEV